jgi:DNA-binding phage protein
VETRQRTGSGKLVDENGRGPLAETDMAAAKTLEQKTWNKMRVVARGNTIEVYLHDVLACKIEDEAFISGYIGLQSFASGMTEAAAVQYRNIRVKDLGRGGEWRALFNGENFDAWENYGEEDWWKTA